MTEFSAKEFGGAFKTFLEKVNAAAPTEEPVFQRKIREHFGEDPRPLPIVGEQFEGHERPNLQLALDAFLAAEGRTHELLGVVVAHYAFDVGLVQLVAPTARSEWGASPGPVDYMNAEIADGERLACVQRGLYLIRQGERRLVVFLKGAGRNPYESGTSIEVMARDRAEGERFLADLRTAMRKRNVYRGKIVSLDQDCHGQLSVDFHRLPKIEREQIILPDGVLGRIERETIRFARHAEKLRAAGRHLKRGLLLYGPPGTGKTFTAMYLAGQMRERTVLLLVGRALKLIEASCRMARLLQPSIVVIEDVDLVAEERTRGDGPTPILFELLNAMDGLAEDTDVIFLLTTNRAEILEPALAARPGRVDLAVHVPLPDADCRRRLFELYGKGLTARFGDLDRFVARTDGVSAAFIRELVRKATLISADEDKGMVVEDRHLDEALHELLVEGGELTRSILGSSRARPAERNEES